MAGMSPWQLLQSNRDPDGDQNDQSWLLGLQSQDRTPAGRASSGLGFDPLASGPMASSNDPLGFLQGLGTSDSPIVQQLKQAGPKLKAALGQGVKKSPAPPIANSSSVDEDGNVGIDDAGMSAQMGDARLSAKKNFLSEGSKDGEGSKTEVSSVTPGLMSQDDIDRANGAMNVAQAEIQAFQDQRKGIQNSLGLLKNYNSIPTDVDLSPLASLVDSWTGSHFAQGYKKPESADDKQAMIVKLNDAINKDLTGLSKNDLLYLKALSGGQVGYKASNTKNTENSTGANTTAQTPGFNSKATGGGDNTKNEDKWIGRVQGDKSLNAAMQATGGLTDAQKLLSNAQSVSDNEFRYAMLRALHAGRITQYELQGQQGATDWGSKFDQLLNNVETGKLTDENRQQYMQVIQDLNSTASGWSQGRRDYLKNMGIKVYHVNPDKADSILAPQYFQPGRPSTPAQSAPAGGGIPTIDQYFKNKGGQ